MGTGVKSIIGLCVIGVVVLISVAGVWLALNGSGATVLPEPPKASSTPVVVAGTTSHVSVAISCANDAIVAKLDSAIPKTFPFDVKNGARAYGSPSRGAIKLNNDLTAKRALVSAPVSGRVQVEKKVIANISVGIDVAGRINASFSPVFAKDWTIDPKFDVSAQVDRAVAKTAVGDIDITGHVRGAVNGAVAGAKSAAAGKLAEALNIRKDVESLWNKLNGVYKLADDPPTWIRVTPEAAAFVPLHYAANSIDSGLTLTLKTHVFLQTDAPRAVSATLPELNPAGQLSNDVILSLPIAVSYELLNHELRSRLCKAPFDLPEAGASLTITDASLLPYGEGVLLKLEFSGRKGVLGTVSGRLYIVGVPVFDARKSELRIEKLEYTAETKNLLVKGVDWLAHSKILEEMQAAAVVNLSAELAKAKTKANERIENLKKQLPPEFKPDLSVNEIGFDRLTFSQDHAFALGTVKGKFSTRIQK